MKVCEICRRPVTPDPTHAIQLSLRVIPFQERIVRELWLHPQCAAVVSSAHDEYADRQALRTVKAVADATS